MSRTDSDSSIDAKENLHENEQNRALLRSRINSKSCLMLGQIRIPNIPDDANLKTPLTRSRALSSSSQSIVCCEIIVIINLESDNRNCYIAIKMKLFSFAKFCLLKQGEALTLSKDIYISTIKY